MEGIVKNKLKEIYILKKKTINQRLKYTSFIKQYKKTCINDINRLMKYKMTIVERKINSPLYGLNEKRTIIRFIKDIKISEKILSVLIDRKHFGSSYYELTKIYKGIGKVLSLKKEFIINIVQLYLCIYESRLLLVINHLNSKKKTKNIINIARVLNIIVIKEVKDIEELLKIKKKEGVIVGINSRDLNNFKIKKKNIINKITKRKNLIFESGINNKNELVKIRNIGFKNTLVGSGLSSKEFFTRSKN
ncbi:hypothetical protein [Candidatus Vidania fulgoroideorum]